MERKAASGIMMTLLLASMFTLAFNIQPVKASGTIYIRADGRVDPPTAPISSIDNVTYAFTANIYDSIVVERDNIVVDGANYKVEGTGALWSTGIYLDYRNNVTIKNAFVTRFNFGIYIHTSSNNTLISNTMTNNTYGMTLLFSGENTLSGNNATKNYYNFEVDGWYFSNFNNNVDTSNTVDGKPIIYWVGVANAILGEGSNAGTVYLISGQNITVKDLTLTKNRAGIFLWNTTNSKIENVTIAKSYYGIRLDTSCNNALSGNACMHFSVSSWT